MQQQREQAAKNASTNLQQPGIPQANIVRPGVPPQAVESTAVLPDSTVPPQSPAPGQLVVNPKTKTALANMLSIRLQGGQNVGPPGADAIPEPSAAGTLR